MESSNKVAAKNTVILFIRMLLNTLIGLYTSRVVLQTLGVNDFGIYGIVGSTVTMFSALSSSMSNSTVRFLNYTIGENNINKLNMVFSSSVIIHVILAFIIFLLIETFGLWLLYNKLVISVERMDAAILVFHLSSVSMIFTIIKIPYNSLIISFEKMGIYATIEIFYSILQLLIVYLLQIFHFDKLELYGFLILVVNIFIFVIYIITCSKIFQNIKLKIQFNKSIIYPMLKFSGWNFIGHISLMARTTGINIVENLYFGTIINAATSLATKIQNAVMALSSSVSMALRPQIIKAYARGEHEDMISKMRNGAYISYILMLIPTIPLIVEMDYILKLWLGIIPPYTSTISSLILLWNLFLAFNQYLGIACDSTGNIAKPNVFAGLLYISVIPFSFIAFELHWPYWVPFLYNIIAVCITAVTYSAHLVRYIRGYSYKQFVLIDWSKAFIILLIIYISSILLKNLFNEGFFRLIIITFITSLLSPSLGLFIFYSKENRHKLISTIKFKLCKRI